MPASFAIGEAVYDFKGLSFPRESRDTIQNVDASIRNIAVVDMSSARALARSEMGQLSAPLASARCCSKSSSRSTKSQSGHTEARYARLLGATGSPEGSDVAFAVHYADSYACWDGEDIELVVASRDRVRARILNKLGLRRYRSGDLYAASELFRQATREDEDYAWGWYNSAALHSVHDEQNEALISLRTALELDPSKAERACNDADFEGLRDTARGAELLGCEP